MDDRVTYFAKTDARNKQIPFGIKAKDRPRHVYIIGKTGMGKSTVLENMIIQDIRNNEGLAFIDPHGKSAEMMLDYIPQERIDDVLYFAPFDMDYPIAFNVMEDVGYDKRHLVVSGLMSAFKKIWLDAWSARMEYILTNTLLALLEYPDATMLGVNRMYTDKVYRKKVVENVKDPLVRSFWVDEFTTYTDRYTQEATPAIQNKVGQFTGNPLIRNIVGQSKSTFDIRQMMDNRKIIIMNLSKGKVGEQNANLLGSMLITKIYLAGMSRADVSQAVLAKLPNFYFYVDEFQSFANESFADILSEARKYKLNLTMAHQYIEQMSDEVRAAVFGNVGTMITFRVGAYDAEVLEKEFAPQFTAEDLVNLGFSQIYLKLMIDGVSSQPFSARTLPPLEPPKESSMEKVLARSRARYARPRALVEAEIEAEYASKQPQQEGSKQANQKGRETKEGREFTPGLLPRQSQDDRERPRVSFGGGSLQREVSARTSPTPNASQEKSREEHQPFKKALGNLDTSDREKPGHRVRETGSGHVPGSSSPHLWDGKRKEKGPTAQSRGSLREALAEVLKKEGEALLQGAPEKATMAKETRDPQAFEKAAGPSEKMEYQHAPKEVSEELLRAVLRGEEKP